MVSSSKEGGVLAKECSGKHVKENGVSYSEFLYFIGAMSKMLLMMEQGMKPQPGSSQTGNRASSLRHLLLGFSTSAQSVPGTVPHLTLCISLHPPSSQAEKVHWDLKCPWKAASAPPAPSPLQIPPNTWRPLNYQQPSLWKDWVPAKCLLQLAYLKLAITAEFINL